jgi:hypothetical protein
MDENLNFDVRVKVSEIKKHLAVPFLSRKKKQLKRKKKKDG